MIPTAHSELQQSSQPQSLFHNNQRQHEMFKLHHAGVTNYEKQSSNALRPIEQRKKHS